MSPEVVHRVLDILHHVLRLPELQLQLVVTKPHRWCLSSVRLLIDNITETVDVTPDLGEVTADAVAVLVGGGGDPGPHVWDEAGELVVVGPRHVRGPGQAGEPPPLTWRRRRFCRQRGFPFLIAREEMCLRESVDDWRRLD